MKPLISLIMSVVLLTAVFNPIVASAAAEDKNDLKASAGNEGNSAEAQYYFDYAAGYFESAVTDITVFDGEMLCSAEKDYEFFLTAPSDAWYNVTLVYEAGNDSNTEIGFGIRLDGKYPFYEADRFVLSRLYVNEGKVRTDGMGNEFAPEQKEVHEKQMFKLSNYSTFENKATKFFFSKGEHSLRLGDFTASVKIFKIILTVVEELADYAEVSEKYGEYPMSGDAEITVQGEDAVYKSEFDLVGKTDSSSAAVYPKDPFKQKVNYIGSNWSDVGEKLTWNINVPNDGLYKLSFHYRQSFILNGNAYRTLEIDGKVPFREAEAISFPYGNGWENLQLSDENGKPYMLYLSKGEHTLSLTVTLGPLTSFCNKLNDTVFEIGNCYRRIVMITGETPDNNRDYNLFSQIPDLEEKLKSIVSSLDELSGIYEGLSGKRGGSTVSILNNMKISINGMLKYKYKAQRYKSAFYSAYSSISATLYDIMDMPLNIDSFTLSSSHKETRGVNAGLFEKISYSVERFIASFIIDYNNISGDSAATEKITLWINWGRDQAQVLNSLIKSEFVPQTGIGVNVKITNASLVQGILSGNSPDCVLQQQRSEPVNLALRNAAYNLKQFADYGDIIKRFAECAVVPYEYNGGVYGLPDTQSFLMLFIRTDIFKEMGLEIPKTWDEFIDTLTILSANNLQTGIAGNLDNAATNVSAVSTCFNMFLAQFGGNLYNNDLNATDLLTPQAISAFEFFTDFFTKYNCPKTYNFYNRFRTGIMPMGIQSNQMYSTIAATAPEIKNRWVMAPVPGLSESEAGTSVGAGTAAVILKDSKNHEEAWEFIKWWTSCDIQLLYIQALESVLGISARVSTSNIEASSKLSWDGKCLGNMLTQWRSVKEYNEIPGSYYVPRVIDQAYWNVVENNERPKDMLYTWSKTADSEIRKKIKQYGK